MPDPKDTVPFPASPRAGSTVSAAATSPLLATPSVHPRRTSRASGDAAGSVGGVPLSPGSPNQQRQGSIADLLSTPPPLSSESPLQRRGSTTSNRSSDDGSSVASLSSVQQHTNSGSSLPSQWQDVQMHELVQKENLVCVDGDTSVENAFDILAQHQFTSLPIRMSPTDTHISTAFDYADLNAYLLLVLGRIEPVDDTPEVTELVKKAQSGRPVPVSFAAKLGVKNPLITLSSEDTIASAAQILGSGVHRIAITDAASSNLVTGVLSQRRLIRFLWENGRKFKSLEPLFQTTLDDLGIGSKKVISINGEELVVEALQKMHDEGVSSLAVTDSHNNLLGNISIVDVRLVTKSSQKGLLRSTCKNFLSVILNKRGLEDGKDSYPVFHVFSNSSLGRIIAKLVATKAHRLWIVQAAAPNEAGAAAAQRSNTAGQLVGVVSLTDILHTLAKHAGKAHLDPDSARRQRRRSSSASVRSRASLDKFRRSVSIERGPPR